MIQDKKYETISNSQIIYYKTYTECLKIIILMKIVETTKSRLRNTRLTEGRHMTRSAKEELQITRGFSMSKDSKPYRTASRSSKS